MTRTRLLSFACAALWLLVLAAVPASASGATLVEKNFFFSPSTVTVTQGSTLVLSNPSSSPHTFTVSGQGIDVQTNPGQTGSVAINLPPGTYSFICKFHSALGMTGTLVVQTAASSRTTEPSASATPVGGPQTGAGGTAHRPFPALWVGIGSALVAAGLVALRRRRRA